MSKRDLRIDTARGIACILLVSYHTIGNSPATGLRLAVDSPIAVANSWLAYLRMPLFTVLSGKVLRLILPLICVGYLFAVVQMITPGANYKISAEQLPLLMFWPYEHFWFLQALFIVFITISVLDINYLLKRKLSFISIFCISAVLFIYRDNFTSFFSFNKALYLFPFFVFGIGMSRFCRNLQKSFDIFYLLSAPLIGLFVTIFIFGKNGEMEKFYPLLLGLLLCTTVISCVKENELLAKIGVFSYSIYLFHVFGTSAVRIFLFHCGIHSLTILFPACLMGGLLFPIAVYQLVRSIPYLSRLMIGARCRPRTI